MNSLPQLSGGSSAHSQAQNKPNAESVFSSHSLALPADKALEINKSTLQERQIALCGSAAEKSWQHAYEKTSNIFTSSLRLTYFSYSDEDYAFIRKLNDEYHTKQSEWTPIDIEDSFSNEAIKSIFEIKKLVGGYFARTWFIRLKQTNELIGLLTTSGVKQDGFCEIQRHILLEHRRKGFGSEALIGVYNHYKGISSKAYPRLEKESLKSMLAQHVYILADIFLKKPEAILLKERFMDFSSLGEEALKMIELFPYKVKPTMVSIVSRLSRDDEREALNICGLYSYPISTAAKMSLSKCGFQKDIFDYKRKF